MEPKGVQPAQREVHRHEAPETLGDEDVVFVVAEIVAVEGGQQNTKDHPCLPHVAEDEEKYGEG